MSVVRVGYATSEVLAGAAHLLAECFPKVLGLRHEDLAWCYLENPHGPAIVAQTVDDSRVVAHVAFGRMYARWHDTVVSGLLVQHAATAADQRQRGHFTGLVTAALAFAQCEGFAFAVAAASRATHAAFVGRLAFTDVEPLDVRLVFGKPRVRARVAAPVDFEVLHDDAWWRWRTAPPRGHFRFARTGTTTLVACDSGSFRVPVLLGEEPASATPSSVARRPLVNCPVHVDVGLDPRRVLPVGIDLPLALRPSPLRLVVRSLTADRQQPRPGHVVFGALDFDAW